MDSKTRIDYALFQLTPTRTRCDLVIFAGKKKEKIASGLLEPFVCHLKSAKEQISKGGYSITLQPSSSDHDPSWFTKAILERFVKFVSTPEVLERIVTIEREINQIESSFESNDQSIELQGTPSATDYGDPKTPSKSSDTEAEQKPKVRLQRVLGTRMSMLKKEQAMAYARALVAGFEMDYLHDLVSFSDAFGAQRLREACLNFMELCNKKNDDKIWMDEVAAMQASYLGASGNINVPPISGSISRHVSMDPSEGLDNGLPAEFNQQQQADGAAQLPTSWPHHLPHYMQNSQPPPMYQPYPGYIFPGMQAGPPHYPTSMPWPPANPDRDGRRHKTHKKRHANTKNEEIIETDSSSSENDSSDERINNKTHNKNHSRKVVIRNINYIASSRNENSNDSGDNYSSNDDEHVGSSKRHNKSDSNRKASGKPKISLDAEDENTPNYEEGKKDGNWDIFQNLLLRNPDSKSNDIPDHKDENTYPLDMKSKYASDDLIFTERSTGNGFDETGLKFESGETFHGFVKRQHKDEFLIPPRDKEGEHCSQTAHFSAEPSIVLPIGENKKDILSDESFMMVQSRIPDGPQRDHPRDDIFMVADMVGAKESKSDGLPGNSNFYEPEDLKMMLGQDSVTEQGVASWSHDMENDILAVEAVKSQINTEPRDTKQVRDGNKASKTGASTRKVVSGKETKPKAPSGSLGRSKSDIPPRSKTSTAGMSRSKSGKNPNQEEEKRKKMEEILMQRQKRIAERSAAKGVAPETTSKRSSVIESKKNNSVSTKANKLRPPVDENKKSSKPVMRSSTIDRLAAARTTNNPSPTKQKVVQSKKPTPNGKSVKPTPLVKKTQVDSPATKNRKNINSEKLEKTQAKNNGIIEDSESVKVLLHTESSFKAREDKNDSNQVIFDNVNDDEVVNPTKGNDLKSSVSNVDEVKSVEKKMLTFSPEISAVGISTPRPDDETNDELNHSRKKWNNGESSPKIPKGFRRLLLFGRRT